MDPTTCYREMLAAMDEGDFLTARDRATDLKRWLDRGGFAPAGTDWWTVVETVGRVLCRTVYPD